MKLLAAQLAAPHQQQQQVPGWQLAALQLPLLQQVVFATSKSNKSWAAATLTYIRTQQQQQQQQQQQLQGSVAALPHSSSSSSTACTQGPLAALGVIKQLLQQWWQPQQQQQQQQQILDPVSWLDGFAEALKQQQQQQQQQQSDATAITSSSGVSPTSPQAFAAWCNSQGCNPAVQLLLAALLQHPDAATASAAGTVVQLLLLRLPQLAPSFLPVVMQQLRQSYATAAAAAAGGAGDSSAAAAAAGQRVQQLLVLLQAMCKDPSCAALVWRVLHPLLSAAQQQQQQQQQQSPHIKQLGSSSSGNLLRGLAVQLSVAAWQQTGRGWGRAEAAVNGCVSLSGVLPQDRARELGRQPLELRLIRAAAVR